MEVSSGYLGFQEGQSFITSDLKHYGVRGNLLGRTGFLSARPQECVIEDQKSSPSPVTLGVPQGSVFGPLLFIGCIYDMQESVTSKFRLFADDSLLYRKVQQRSDCLELQQDLERLQQWWISMWINIKSCICQKSDDQSAQITSYITKSS